MFFFIQGDSGSPLICNKKLTGIVSFGPAKDCGQDNRHPGVYTNVGFFKNWIEKLLSRHKQSKIVDFHPEFVHPKILKDKNEEPNSQPMKEEINFKHDPKSYQVVHSTKTDKKIKSKSMKDEVNFDFHKKSKLIPKNQLNNDTKKKSYDSISNEVNFNFHKKRLGRIHPTEYPPNNTANSFTYYYSSNNYFQSQMIYLQALCTLLLCLIPQR